MTCAIDSKKLMFEIYRDPNLERGYRVVYFTELGEHEKEEEIASAMRGEHVFDGFILHRQRQEAKELIEGLLDRLNRGESLTATEIADRLKPYMT
ncbi:MAG: hypothetical protein ROO76_05410 [Terriglobia bacterium]|jgi:hypothetical protein|nr:hypothetical protein [Terriglobia bacterium]